MSSFSFLCEMQCEMILYWLDMRSGILGLDSSSGVVADRCVSPNICFRHQAITQGWEWWVDYVNHLPPAPSPPQSGGSDWDNESDPKSIVSVWFTDWRSVPDSPPQLSQDCATRLAAITAENQLVKSLGHHSAALIDKIHLQSIPRAPHNDRTENPNCREDDRSSTFF